MRYSAIAIAVAFAASLGVVWPEIPAWRLGGTHAQKIEPVAASSQAVACPHPGETIELRGDSHVAGGRMKAVDGLPSLPYGRILEEELGGAHRVLVNGTGGATAADGEQIGESLGKKGDLVFLAYGTNDAAPRGWLRNKTRVPIASFEASLTKQIQKEKERGARVGLIAPPPAGSSAINHRIRPYREAVARLANALEIPIIDPAIALNECAGFGPLLGFDALHLNSRGHKCLGDWIARSICPSTSPQP